MIHITKNETAMKITKPLMNVIETRAHKIPPFWAIWDVYIMLVDAIKENLKNDFCEGEWV